MSRIVDAIISVALAGVIYVVVSGGGRFQVGGFDIGVTSIRNPLLLFVFLVVLRLSTDRTYASGMVKGIHQRWTIGIALSLTVAHVWVVLANFIEIPFGDQFDFLNVYRVLSNPTEYLGPYFGFHGGHWHTTAFVVMYLLARITGWNLLWEAVASLLLLVLAYGLLFQAIRRVGSRPEGHVVQGYLFVVTVIFLSFGHTFNLLWTWQVAVLLAVFGVALVIYSLSCVRHLGLAMSIAVIGAVVASYSFANGFLAWPAGLLLLLFRGGSRWGRLRSMALWLAAAGAVCWHYWMAYGNARHSVVERDPGQMMDYVATYLGASVLSYAPVDVAAWIGYVAMGALAVLTFRVMRRPRDEWSLYAVPYAFVSIGLGGAILTSVGRVGFGSAHAFEMRYYSFSMFFWMGLVGVVLLSAPNVKHMFGRRWYARDVALKLSVLVLTFLFFTSGLAVGRRSIEIAGRVNGVVPDLLVTYPRVPRSILETLHYPPGVDHTARFLHVMHSKKLNVFRERGP